MAVAATLTITPASAPSGATITATYAVTGNDGTPDVAVPVAGHLRIGDVNYNVNTSFTAVGQPPLPVQAYAPTGAGLTFVATADPLVFTATVVP